MCYLLSPVQLLGTPWTAALQVPLSMGFSRQEHWSMLPFPSPGDLSNPGIEPTSFMYPALAGRFFTTSTTWEAKWWHRWNQQFLITLKMFTDLTYLFKKNLTQVWDLRILVIQVFSSSLNLPEILTW